MKVVKVALEWFLNPDHLPLIVSEREGWWRAAGLALEMVEPSAHADAGAMLADGTVDVAITEPLHLLAERAAGRDVLGFARFLHTNGGVMYPTHAGIRRPKDLAGKRIQYPGAPGPGGLAIARTMIAADGGDAAAPLVPVNYGFRHTDALVEGAADAATLAFYNFEILEARHRGLEVDFFALKDWGVPDFCQLHLMTMRAAMAEQAPVLGALATIMRRAVDFIKQMPGRARAHYRAYVGAEAEGALADAIYEATVPCFTHDPDLTPGYFARLGRWMAATGQLAPSSVWNEASIWWDGTDEGAGVLAAPRGKVPA